MEMAFSKLFMMIPMSSTFPFIDMIQHPFFLILLMLTCITLDKVKVLEGIIFIFIDGITNLRNINIPWESSGLNDAGTLFHDYFN